MRQRRHVVVAVFVAIAIGGIATPATAAGGTLTAGDSGLEVLAEPHESTVLVVDSVAADCTPGETFEQEATVVSFAEDLDAPAAGARLNQILYDLGSASAAKSFFAARRAAEQERVKCGSTAKATKLKFLKGPAGVGDTRFTVTSDEKIGGATAKVVAVVVRSGASVTQLNFIAWEPGLAGTTAVVKKAVGRLS